MKSRKQKKIDLYQYKQVKILTNRTINLTKGVGHHASPRAHDRIGHWRTLRSGKAIWIHSTKVKSANGSIDKDYIIT